MESQDFCAWSLFLLDVCLFCSYGLPSLSEQEVPFPVEVGGFQPYLLHPSPSVPCSLLCCQVFMYVGRSSCKVS